MRKPLVREATASPSLQWSTIVTGRSSDLRPVDYPLEKPDSLPATPRRSFMCIVTNDGAPATGFRQKLPL
ncbi:MAG: hypothetical protein ACKON9_27890, partial [Planctomycetaceae bacterium]